MKFIYVFVLTAFAGMLCAGQLLKKHASLADVDREIDEIYRESVRVVIADRAPSDNDVGKAGTFWIDKSSTVIYVRFPQPSNWRKIATTAP